MGNGVKKWPTSPCGGFKLQPIVLTPQQIRQAAPDGATFDKAVKLATTRKWLDLEGRSGRIWGRCKSSKATYFQVVADLKRQAYRCNCAYAKWPCPHILALLLLHLEQSEAFRQTEEEPDWATRLGAQLLTEAPQTTDADLERQQLQRQKTREKRFSWMDAGFGELETWLEDAVGQGLAALAEKPREYWEQIAARMVDAKLPGVARRLRAIPSTIMGPDGWHEVLLGELGELYLLLQGFRQLEELPEGLQSDLLTVAGVNLKKSELEDLPGVQDEWLVVGVTAGAEDNLQFRRTWLQGQAHDQLALLLDFAWGDSSFERDWRLGQWWEAELVFYPSAAPQRALLRSAAEAEAGYVDPLGFPDLPAFAGAYADGLAANPWLLRFPAWLREVVPLQQDGQWLIVDPNRYQLPLQLPETSAWRLLALSGGRPLHLFGEWNGQVFSPLSAAVDGQLFGL